jgi:hypothetical protein
MAQCVRGATENERLLKSFAPRKIGLTVNRIAPVHKARGSNDRAEYSAVMG